LRDVHYHKDQIGSVRAVTQLQNVDGSDQLIIKWHGDYTPYGEILTEDFLLRWLPLKTFALHEYDKTTSLLYMQARWFDPLTAQFTSEDPALDGLNWYAYAGANPLGGIDPTGLRVEQEDADKEAEEARKAAEEEESKRLEKEKQEAAKKKADEEKKLVEAAKKKADAAQKALEDAGKTPDDIYKEFIKQVIDSADITKVQKGNSFDFEDNIYKNINSSDRLLNLKGTSKHAGVDVAATTNDAATADANGVKPKYDDVTVINPFEKAYVAAGTSKDGGNYIQLFEKDENGKFTGYSLYVGHVKSNDEFSLKGTTIEKGDQVGTLSNTGDAVVPKSFLHGHFEIRYQPDVDKKPYLRLKSGGGLNLW
jgi:RHS repeat-associated protein